MKLFTIFLFSGILTFASLSKSGEIKKPSSLLVENAQITYSDNGNESDPLTITFVEFKEKIGPFRNCAIVGVKFSAESSESFTTECVGANSMLVTAHGSGEFYIDRPIIENGYYEVVADNGNRLQAIETKGFKKFTVSDMEFDALETIETHYDDKDNPVIRVRSFFSVELGTNLAGENQIPDDQNPGKWKTFNKFKVTKYKIKND